MKWWGWFEKGPTATLYKNSKFLEDISINSLKLAGGVEDEEEDSGQRTCRVRRKCQATVRKLLKKG